MREVEESWLPICFFYEGKKITWFPGADRESSESERSSHVIAIKP